jgi:hypothetical protein
MSSNFRIHLIRSVLSLCAAASLAAVFASAQSSPSSNSSSSSLFRAGKSSSNEFHLDFGTGSGSGTAAYSSSALPAAFGSGGSGMGAGQEERHGWKKVASHGLAFEVGGGFNAPIGNDTSSNEGGPFITWGGNLTAGAGVRFSQHLSLLGEFQFIDNKLPGVFIAEAGAGATNGNTHIVSIAAAPVIDLFPRSTNSVYLTGGGGYYHKSTNFSVQVCCDFYGYPVAINTNSFSSNQPGGSLGIGYTRRLGGTYGDSTMKLFGEARYLYINTPRVGEVNGLGRTELIPVTVGVRW